MITYPATMVLPKASTPGVVSQACELLERLVCELPKSLLAGSRDDDIKASISIDLEDVRQSAQGDSDAYRRLIERHQAHVSRILWRFSRDPTVHEELVQDVFVEAYLSINTYLAKAPFANWLARIATRVGHRYWKQTARRKKLESLSLQEWDQIRDDDAAVDRMEPDQAARLLYRLLENLPPRDRLVLTLRYLEQCDVAETAHRIGWTKTMVKVQTLRAKQKMRKLLGQTEREMIK